MALPIRLADDSDSALANGLGENSSAAVQTRHHGSQRNTDDLGGIAVRQVGHIDQLDRLSKARGERGKCALKALQYMALGVPPVVSPVGVNVDVVQEGVTGRFAGSSAEWEEALLSLIESPELRLRLGTAARARVEADFSARVHAPRVAQLFREAAA